MQLEDYFDFETEPVERIRIKGTRIDLDFVVDHFNRGMKPEEIATHFTGPLELEQVYSTITYYLHYRAEPDCHLKRRHMIADQNYRAYLAQAPTELINRLGAARAQQQTSRAH